ncbi:LysR family transcriptional regulator [Roseovarius sp. A21]|uniref:LysR family transcriptional regulator n=1 Tax=Roseovarius bejariae TaxID=2576383 RepID=A0A844D040_9RHOB|nr:LysR substrate-binding domain-containing protein [Roseovarius bejariae]MRU14508.1 LysR family transcriptional regulator [Roseovarius bejariae]
MRLDWLEDILAVLDTGSFVRAAERRNLTQSAFTRRIRAIEDSLGAPLFDRSRKPVTLLPAIREQEAQMRRLASDLRALGDSLRGAALGQDRAISLACQHAITTTVSPALVRQLTEATGASVRVRSGNRDECLLMLLSGEVDLVVSYDLAGVDAAPTPAFHDHTLGQETLRPVCTPAVAKSLRTGNLPVITYPRDVFLGQVMDSQVWPRLPSGTHLHRKAETALTLAAYHYALDGIGVAWLPGSLVANDLASGALVDPFSGSFGITLEIRLLRLRDVTRPGVREAWDILVQDGA